MRSSSITEWRPGDKGVIEDGSIVTVKRIAMGSRMVEIEEDLEKKLYIPAHGEIAHAAHDKYNS